MPDALEDILAEAENPAYVRTQTAKVLFRQDLVTRHAELDAELAAAIARDRTTNEPDQAPVIAHQIAELQDEMTAALREFTFKNIGKKAWADLLAQHPPTKEQLAVEAEEAKEQGRKPRFFDHNLETFPIAAMAAASHSPKMDEDAVRRLEAALTDSQFTLLWRACFDANLGGADVPKSLAAGQILRVNGQYANTAVLAASPAASS
jgi:hypothetical protein